jgi:orotate phosphoribosyltransferase
VVSAAVGGIVLGYEVARQLGTDAIFVEKENGSATLRRSFRLTPHDRALVVEDVVTTGLSVREVIDVVRKHGAQVAGVGVIVQRGHAEFNVPTRALLDMPLESYDPAECPLCKAGQSIDDPGSRRS